ncbi:MAG: glycosyltransferase, partial [Anaerolineae bacterium]|nr:glycosyltransferase [Anaerolineae bacterium]
VKEDIKPVLSVIIPCLNVAEVLPLQLRALSEQQYCDHWEVIIADNGSSDGTINVAEGFRQQLPALTITSESRRGRHYACNSGVQAAHGDLIVFVDGDDEVAPGFLEAMVIALKKRPIVGGKLDHVALSGKDEQPFGRVQTDGLMDGFGFLPYAMGCCMGIRKEVFESIGGFQDKNYCEDADLCWRLQLAGYQIEFSSEAVVRYRQRSSYGHMFRQHRNFGEAHVLLYRDFRIHGMTRRSLRKAISEWLLLLISFVRLRTADEQARWFRRLGKCVGHITGSIKYHVFYP